MENFEQEPKIIEMRPVQLKHVEKANSEILISRKDYGTKSTNAYKTDFFKALLSHRIDDSPRLRSFSI
jgi:cobyric acid synthase